MFGSRGWRPRRGTPSLLSWPSCARALASRWTDVKVARLRFVRPERVVMPSSVDALRVHYLLACCMISWLPLIEFGAFRRSACVCFRRMLARSMLAVSELAADTRLRSLTGSAQLNADTASRPFQASVWQRRCRLCAAPAPAVCTPRAAASTLRALALDIEMHRTS